MINPIDKEKNKKILETIATNPLKLMQNAMNTTKPSPTTTKVQNGQTLVYPENYTTRVEKPKVSGEDDITKLAYMQRQDKQIELERAKKTNLSNLAAEKTSTQGQYRTAMNETATQADIALKNYYENVANRGQTNSGSTAQGELSQNVAKQNAMSGLQTAQSSALADIERRKSLVEQGYLSDVNSANTAIGINEMQNKINLQREQDQLNRAAQEKAMNNSINTVGQYGNDFMAEIQRREALDPNDPLLPYLRMARQDKISGIATQQAKAADTEYERNMEQAKLMADMGDFTGLKSLGYDTTQLEREWNANLAKINRTNTGSTGGSGRSSNPNASKAYTSTLETASEMATKMEALPFGLEGTRNAYGTGDITRYVQTQGLSDEEEFDILTSLGIL